MADQICAEPSVERTVIGFNHLPVETHHHISENLDLNSFHALQRTSKRFYEIYKGCDRPVPFYLRALAFELIVGNELYGGNAYEYPILTYIARKGVLWVDHFMRRWSSADVRGFLAERLAIVEKEFPGKVAAGTTAEERATRNYASHTFYLKAGFLRATIAAFASVTPYSGEEHSLLHVLSFLLQCHPPLSAIDAPQSLDEFEHPLIDEPQSLDGFIPPAITHSLNVACCRMLLGWEGWDFKRAMGWCCHGGIDFQRSNPLIAACSRGKIDFIQFLVTEVGVLLRDESDGVFLDSPPVPEVFEMRIPSADYRPPPQWKDETSWMTHVLTLTWLTELEVPSEPGKFISWNEMRSTDEQWLARWEQALEATIEKRVEFFKFMIQACDEDVDDITRTIHVKKKTIQRTLLAWLLSNHNGKFNRHEAPDRYIGPTLSRAKKKKSKKPSSIFPKYVWQLTTRFVEVLLELGANPNVRSVEDEDRSVMGWVLAFGVRKGATRWDRRYGLGVLELLANAGGWIDMKKAVTEKDPDRIPNGKMWGKEDWMKIARLVIRNRENRWDVNGEGLWDV
ncbi:hypothetical protein BJ508DRAFT_419572 [Ascobolus immersus RN42]|uniref:F-box domain-containing protein n=1 Tax=Ascobolus immersus RN42 TaxID=1160509 RepID=A0A3N4HD22_ASCIM|nr:hypothetical protein BJ508DRAFT_419572 [Ascobolus immersus RN42]